MKVMIDSNIIISAIRDPERIPYAAYVKASRSPYRIILCGQIMEEVYEVFKRKFPESLPAIRCFFKNAAFEIVGTPHKVDETEARIKHSKDRPILRAALAAEADIFITGDKDFLTAGISNPKVITASEFVNNY